MQFLYLKLHAKYFYALFYANNVKHILVFTWSEFRVRNYSFWSCKVHQVFVAAFTRGSKSALPTPVLSTPELASRHASPVTPFNSLHIEENTPFNLHDAMNYNNFYVWSNMSKDLWGKKNLMRMCYGLLIHMYLSRIGNNNIHI